MDAESYENFIRINPDMKKYKNKISQETKTKQDLLNIIEEIRENYIN